MKRNKGIGTMLLLGFALSLWGQEEEKWYFELTTGWNDTGDETLNLNENERVQSAEAAFDPGFAAGGALGYRFSPKFRLEAEMMYRTSDLDEVSFPQSGTLDEGDYASLALAGNLFYDVNLFGSEKARSFIGIGPVWLQEVDVDLTSNGLEQSYSGDEVGFQVLAGVNYRLGPRWDLSFEARFLDMGGITMDGEENATGQVTADYAPVSAMASIGFRF